MAIYGSNCFLSCELRVPVCAIASRRPITIGEEIRSSLAPVEFACALIEAEQALYQGGGQCLLHVQAAFFLLSMVRARLKSLAGKSRSDAILKNSQNAIVSAFTV